MHTRDVDAASTPGQPPATRKPRGTPCPTPAGPDHSDYPHAITRRADAQRRRHGTRGVGIGGCHFTGETRASSLSRQSPKFGWVDGARQKYHVTLRRGGVAPEGHRHLSSDGGNRRCCDPLRTPTGRPDSASSGPSRASRAASGPGGDHPRTRLHPGHPDPPPDLLVDYRLIHHRVQLFPFGLSGGLVPGRDRHSVARSTRPTSGACGRHHPGRTRAASNRPAASPSAGGWLTGAVEISHSSRQFRNVTFCPPGDSVPPPRSAFDLRYLLPADRASHRLGSRRRMSPCTPARGQRRRRPRSARR